MKIDRRIQKRIHKLMHKNMYSTPAKTEKLSTNAQKNKFSIKDFFSKRDQIRRKLKIWSHLLKKSLLKNFIFCAVYQFYF